MTTPLFVTYTLAQADDPPPSLPDTAPAPDTGQTPGETQPGGTQDPDGPAPPPAGGFGDYSFFFLMIGLLVVMMIFFSSSTRREKKKRQAMLDTMKKGDRIQSVGGIIGTVIDIRDDEVVVKVDENTNTRLRFARNAVQAILNDKDKTDA